MANNARVSLVFEIQQDGSLKLVTKDIEKAAAATDKLNRSQAAAEKTERNANNTREKGVIGTANSTKSFSKLAQTIGDGNAGLVGAYAGLAANAFAVSAAFNVLNSAAQSQSIMQGLIVQGEKAGKTLTVLSSKIKAITRDAISSTEAMQAVTLGSSAGIASADLEKITEVATNASLALGRSIPDSLNRMTLAITKMEPELVDELGLTTKITEASERYARQNNITVQSMTQAQKQQALLNAWVEQGTLKYEGLKDAVDPNPYEKLASTFKDLTTDGLKLINFFLEPLISLLGDSKGALLGLGAVFLSSIRGQVIPGITGVSKTAFETAEKAKKESIDALKNEKGLAAGKRKAINEFIEASKEGIATEEQLKKAREESNARIQAAKDRPGAKEQTINRVIAEETKRQQELTKIKEQSTKASVAQAQAMGYAASEGVTFSNASTKLKDTIKATTNSFNASYNANKRNQEGFRGLANTAMSSAKGIAAAGKVAAVGFLNFLPIIGQIIAAVTILWELIGKDVWSKLTGRTKEVTEALDAFNATVESTAGKLKAYEKIQLSSASASSRATASVSNQMATVYEIAEAYTQVAAAVEARDRAEERQTESVKEQRSIYQELADARRRGDQEAIKAIQERQKAMAVASRLEVSATSKAAKAFAAQSNEIWMDDEYVAAAQAMEQLEKVMPKVADNFYDINGGVEEFNKLDVDEKLRLINEQLTKAAKFARNVESAFRELTGAVSSLNTGYIDFIKSLSPSTPFDGIVKNLEGVQKGILDTQIAIRDLGSIGGDTTELEGRLAETLTGIEGPSRNMFDSGTRAALNYFDTIDTSLQKSKNELEGMNILQAGYAEKSREVEQLEGKRREILQRASDLVRTGLSDYQQLVTNAQVEAITREGNLAIAQAHLSVLQRQGQVTGEDVRRQMQAENAILELQASQLEAQITILEIDLDREKAALRLLEINRDLLKTFQDQTGQVREQTIRASIQAEEATLRDLEGKTDPKSLEKAAEAQSRLATAQGALNSLSQEQARNEAARVASLNQIRVQEAQILNLRKQAKAIRSGAFTQAEINAAANKKDLENLRETYNLTREIVDLSRTRAQTETRIANTMAMGTDALSNELDAIKQNSEARLSQLRREFQFRKRELEIEIGLAKSRGNSSQVVYYTNLLNLAQDRLDIEYESIETATKEEILNKVLIRSTEDYYSRLQDVANIKQKLVDISIKEMEAQSALNAAILDLEILKKGVTDTQAVQQLKAIRDARDNLDRVNEEANVKRDLIFLEFELLKAKRAQTLSDLAVARFEVEKLRETLRRRKEEASAEVAAARAERDADLAQRSNSPGHVENSDIVVTASISTNSRLGIAEQTLRALETQSNNLDAQLTNMDNIVRYWGSVSEQTLADGANSLRRSLELGSQTAAKRLEIALAQGPRVTEGPMADFRNQEVRASVTQERMSEAALNAGVAAENAQRAARGEVALTTEEIRRQREELIALGETTVQGQTQQQAIALRFVTDELTSHIGKVAEQMRSLGPDGEVAAAAITGIAQIGNSVLDFIDVLKTSQSETAKWAAGLAVVGSMISTVANILKASADAKIAGIDKEIAAEQKRDGKSAASLEKIKSMEKKKDEVARKSFETQKKLQMASVVVNTAAAAMGMAASLSSLGPAAIALIPAAVGMIVALGAAQLALIAGTSYQGQSSSVDGASSVSSLSIGKRGDSVDLARGPNYNAGGEVGYLRGASGTGSNASNFNTIGSAYGGELMRGYGNRGFVVGEKGPEVITPETPITVTPANESNGAAPINATISIQALDASEVQRVLVDQRGNIIQMLRDAANASGQRFLEDVNVNVYTRPNVNRL